MKRVIASVALTLALSALPALAGATSDLSLQHAPGAPHIGTAMCLPGSAGGQLACPVPEPVAAAVSAVEAPVSINPVSAPALVDDSAYGARLHAELCAARPVFCEVDQSGKYLSR